MTVQEIMTKTFQLAGEPSDLCPFTVPGDPTTFDPTLALAGSLPLLGWINEAMIRIANWEDADGTIVRFAHLRKSMYFKTLAVKAGDVISGTSDTIEIDAFNPLNRVGQFNGWVVEVTNTVTGEVQIRLVVKTTGVLAANSVLTVHRDWDTVPDLTCTYRLYKRYFPFVPSPVATSVDDYGIEGDPVNEIHDILKLKDLNSLSELSTPKRTETFSATVLTKGIPTEFKFENGGILFNTPWDQNRSYEILYYANPRPLSAVTDRIEFPAPFHEAIKLWAVHMIQMRDQDFNGAYATKRETQELMRTLRLQGEFNHEQENSGFVVYS